MYPIVGTLHNEIKPFDVVQTIFKDSRPEPHRPESRKIVFGKQFIKVVGHLDKESQRSLLIKYTESGEFLHGDRWRTKSLGMIKPECPRFKFEGVESRITYTCECVDCRGHSNKVFPFLKFDSVGRKKLNKKLIEQVKKCDDEDMRFVMGTVSTHPSKWIIIQIHIL